MIGGSRMILGQEIYINDLLYRLKDDDCNVVVITDGECAVPRADR